MYIYVHIYLLIKNKEDFVTKRNGKIGKISLEVQTGLNLNYTLPLIFHIKHMQ